MELITKEIRLVGKRRYGLDPIVIAPLGDIQWSGKRGSTATDLLRRHIDRCLKLNAWFVGLGDYIDTFSPSNRQRLRGAALYDTAEDVIDSKCLELVFELYEEILKPTKGKWLGLLHGHHWHQMKTGDTTDMRLCQMLDAPFLGTSAFIRLMFTIGNKANWKAQGMENYPLTIFVHHGTGSGMKAASVLNRLENLLPYMDADLLLMGHTTKQAVAPINRLKPLWSLRSGGEVIHKKIYIVGCGGFSKAYETGSKQGQVPMGGYAEQRMLNPAILGAPLIHIRPSFDYEGSCRRNPKSRRGQFVTHVTVEV